MKRARDEEGYKSPKGKLVTFFRKSRDGWKEKARESKTVTRRLKNRIVFLERSKARLQDKVTELGQKLFRLQTHSGERAQELEGVKRDTRKDKALMPRVSAREPCAFVVIVQVSGCALYSSQCMSVAAAAPAGDPGGLAPRASSRALPAVVRA